MHSMTIRRFLVRVFPIVALPILCFSFAKDIKRCRSWTTMDFSMRYHEALLVSRGINPFDVYSEKIVLPDYVPLDKEIDREKYPWDEVHAVHAYTPWEYTLVLPFTLLDYPTARDINLGLQVLSIVFLFAFGWRRALRQTQDRWTSLSVATLSIFFTYPFKASIMSLNFGAFLPVYAIALLESLERRRPLLSGIALLFLMQKPQIGLLFAVTLLLHREFRAVAYGAALCILLTIPPAILCHTSPVDLILCIKEAGTPMLFQPPLLLHPISFFYPNSDLDLPAINAAGMALGTALCVLASVFLKSEPRWDLRLIPPAILCTAWAYSRPYDMCVFMLPLLVLALESLRPIPFRGKIAAVGTSACLLATNLFYFTTINLRCEPRWLVPLKRFVSIDLSGLMPFLDTLPRTIILLSVPCMLYGCWIRREALPQKELSRQ